MVLPVSKIVWQRNTKILVVLAKIAIAAVPLALAVGAINAYRVTVGYLLMVHALLFVLLDQQLRTKKIKY